MRHSRFSMSGFVLPLVAISITAWAEPPRESVEGITVRGTILRIGGFSFVVRVEGGKEITLHSGPKCVFRLNDRAVRFEDMREGMPITAVYRVRGDRFIVSSVTLRDNRTGPEKRVAAAGNIVQGRIIEASLNPNRLVILTPDGKEMILYLDNRPTTFSFEIREGKRMLSSLTTTGPTAHEQASPGPTSLMGIIVRVAGPEKQFVVRTPDGREVIFDTSTATHYSIDGSVAFEDLRPGFQVDVNYTVKDNQHIALRVAGRPRR